MSSPKTIPHDPKTGPAKPGSEHQPSRPGFRDPPNAKSKALKKGKKGKK